MSNPGAIVVSVNAAGVATGDQITLTSVKGWSGFEMRYTDESWTSDAASLDNSNPLCRVKAHRPGKGLNLRSARYEYTTDGGSNWVYWDSEKSDEFEGDELASFLTAEDHNTTGGSATVADGALTIRAEGEDVFSERDINWYYTKLWGHDEFYYVHEEKTGEFEILTKINSQENSNPWALSGILVRDRIEDSWTNGQCYVAATPENGYVFAWKFSGYMINGGDKTTYDCVDARVTRGTVTYPCYLKLSKTFHPAYHEGSETGYNRQFAIFSAYYSTDGMNWEKISSKFVPQTAATQRAGLFTCSGKDGVYGETEFDFYRTHLMASTAEETYSSGEEYLTTAAIPFVSNSDYSQKVRFKIKTQVPYDHFMNHPGYELVSPEYTVMDGENVANVVSEAKAGISLAINGLTLDGNGLKVRYSMPRQGIRSVRFSLYSLDGRKLWSYSPAVEQPAQCVVKWDGRNAAGGAVAAGAYVLKMDAESIGTGSAKSIIKSVLYSGK